MRSMELAGSDGKTSKQSHPDKNLLLYCCILGFAYLSYDIVTKMSVSLITLIITLSQ